LTCLALLQPYLFIAPAADAIGVHLVEPEAVWARGTVPPLVVVVGTTIPTDVEARPVRVIPLMEFSPFLDLFAL